MLVAPNSPTEDAKVSKVSRKHGPCRTSVSDCVCLGVFERLLFQIPGSPTAVENCVTLALGFISMLIGGHHTSFLRPLAPALLILSDEMPHNDGLMHCG